MLCHGCRKEIPDTEPQVTWHDGSVWWYFHHATPCYVEWRIHTLRKELRALIRARRKP